MSSWERELDAMAHNTGFSGVVAVHQGDDSRFENAYGLAHRGYAIPNTMDTRFGIASGTKGLTALTVVKLIEQGSLDLTTSARSVLGTDLPLIDDAVTVEHLLAHHSGIGDYVDEESDLEITDYVLPIPVHRLVDTEDYLAVLDGFPAKFSPGARFAYCNSGYVVLALIAQRVGGRPFHQLVRELVCAPAGMRDTEFLRSDELPGRVAVGYLPFEDVSRTNIFHLPVRGSGDGGVFSTVADFRSFWPAFVAGDIVSPEWVAEMVRPRSDVPEESKRYGLGFWLHESKDVVILEGCDAGVSFQSAHDPSSMLTFTVISNTSDGVWPLAEYLNEQLWP
ncbi:serine hydrolase domain-containing protein [Phytoactinopolyspora mesophila]|uniref:Serine hydrolase n=1 Tax=Phytoactinopolyspora mesophila TaxID=2650750 RepID=A0A7K3M7H6_9ACTN|nr:serine hydrolase domain-containing protein [Phytoactinopolyspora mesophila]NDL59271.1 serine hydrolase [Phytoactinopolyspora mesophila]